MNETTLYFWSFIIVLWIQPLISVFICIRQLLFIKCASIPSELSDIYNEETFSKVKSREEEDVILLYFFTSRILENTIWTALLIFHSFFHLWKFSKTIAKIMRKENSETWVNIIFGLVASIIFFISPFLTIFFKFKAENYKISIEFLIECAKFCSPLVIANFVTCEIITKFALIMRKYVIIASALFVVFRWLIFSEIVANLVTAKFFYEPFPAGETLNRLKNLSENVGFPEENIYVHKGDYTKNAFNVGFLTPSSIVITNGLYDFCMKKKNHSVSVCCEPNHLEAILGHELGHWQYKHVLRMSLFKKVPEVIACAGFFFVFHKPVFKALGFSDEQPIIVAVFLVRILLNTFFFITDIIINSMNQGFEYDADRFVKSLGMGNLFISWFKCMIKSNNDQSIMSDSWYSLAFQDHPTMLDRIRALSGLKITNIIKS